MMALKELVEATMERMNAEDIQKIGSILRRSLPPRIPPTAESQSLGVDEAIAARSSYSFSKYPILHSEVFFTSPLSFAFTNYKPLVPGHVLISPLRIVPKFTDLTQEEVTDVWSVSQMICAMLRKRYSTDSLSISIQDGPAAGQSVPHLHVHLLPRHPGDFPRNDEMYDKLDATNFTPPNKPEETSRMPGTITLDTDHRHIRTVEDMSKEASVYREILTLVKKQYDECNPEG